MREWRGSVLSHRGWLLLKVKDESGAWVQRSTHLEDTPANRRQAERLLAEVRDRLLSLERARGGAPGPLTVRAFSKGWLQRREEAGVADAPNDKTRLDLHVLPAIGELRLEEVRPRHLVEVFEALRRTHAPRTVRNTYSVVKALFRDARIEGALDGPDPAILTHRQLGKVRDAKPGWRRDAIFTRSELRALLADERLPEGRRVAYGLLSLGFLRLGELAGLRWRALDLAVEPLGRMMVATSYDDGTTKTEAERWTPVHPALAALLAGWKVGGWARVHGGPPAPDDLVVPLEADAPRKGRRVSPGGMLDRHWLWKRWKRDLEALGLRHRRVHDLRRTGISLAQDDGARPDVLRWATHAPPTSVFELYTSLHWETVCREVGKMQIPTTTEVAGVVDLVARRAVGSAKVPESDE